MTVSNKSVLFILSLIFIWGCGEKQKSTNKKEVISDKVDSTSRNYFEQYKKRHNLTSNNFEDYKTKYKDGRKSEIRTMFSYEGYDDTLKLYPKNKTGIALIVIEWNENEGVVASESAAFDNQNNNQMYGGDVETNRRITPASRKFIKIGKQFFDNNFDKLTRISEIPNRDLEFVSFDFITTKGIFTVQESLKKLENNTSILSSLFDEGKKLKRKVLNTINTNEWKGK